MYIFYKFDCIVFYFYLFYFYLFLCICIYKVEDEKIVADDSASLFSGFSASLISQREMEERGIFLQNAHLLKSKQFTTPPRSINKQQVFLYNFIIHV
jgi:hypothetical protein